MRSYVCLFACLLVVWPSVGCNGCGDDGDCGGEACIDADGDGHCEVVEDAACDYDDCDDGDGAIYTGAEEACDGKDNDCDGDADEGVTNACGSCGEVPEEVCDGEDNDCDGEVDEGFDADEDGFWACGDPVDCDDGDPAAYPGADESCDGLDDDCNGVADEPDPIDGSIWYRDADEDGYGDAGDIRIACNQPPGYVQESVEDDCDDTEPAINPGATEVCDGVDNDCDHETDEGLWTAYYLDTDGDGWGDETSTTLACQLPPGYTTAPGDCAEGDATVYPGALEVCDELDNDCNGKVDDGDDNDGDGHAVCDCNDGNPTVYPGADEPDCEGLIDYNCDGFMGDADVDDDDVPACQDCNDNDAEIFQILSGYPDDDHDGYGADLETSLDVCSALSLPSGYANQSGDCDDDDPDTNPGRDEVSCDGKDNDCNSDTPDAPDESPWESLCDGIDNNCNGLIDESCWNETDEDPPEWQDARWDLGIWAP